jgi:glycosyltransferase involved in cell wall biosynthesis
VTDRDDVVHVVVPAWIDDPARPSGGNVYDRRVCAALETLGQEVHRVTSLSDLVALPDGSRVLVDGLLASAEPDRLVAHAARLRVVVLVHMPWGHGSAGHRGPEAAMLRSVAAVVTTSEWTRTWLVDQYAVPPDRITVAVPGADRAELAPGSPSGGRLLCVGAVTRTKGHDLLLDALAGIDTPWRLTCVGSMAVERDFATAIRERADGLDGRVVLTGPMHGTDLAAAYHRADVLVLPSRAETYGMVVTEALARGIPVVATRTGGTPEAVGRSASGDLPGLLVPPDDVPALRDALRRWLDDPALRARARAAAGDRRGRLPSWPEAAARIAAALR